MITVAFTGQDGAGKSTQLELLRHALEERGMRVAVVHQYSPVTVLGRTLLPWAKRRADDLMRADHTGDTRLGWVEYLTRRMTAGISLSLGWGRSLRNRLVHRGCDVLMLDRYFTDEIIRAAYKFDCAAGLGMWLLRWAVPRPDVAVSFTVDSYVGWERKKTRELTLEEYEKKVRVTRETLQRAGRFWEMETIAVDGRGMREVSECVWGAVERYVVATR